MEERTGYRDLYEQEKKCHNHTMVEYDKLADRLRERDRRIEYLTKLLLSMKIETDEL